MIFDSDRIGFRHWLDLFICEHVFAFAQPLGDYYQQAISSMTTAFGLQTWPERCVKNASAQRLFNVRKATVTFLWKLEEIWPQGDNEEVPAGYALGWNRCNGFPTQALQTWVKTADLMLWSLTEPEKPYPVVDIARLRATFGFPKEDEMTLIAEVTAAESPGDRRPRPPRPRPAITDA